MKQRTNRFAGLRHACVMGLGAPVIAVAGLLASAAAGTFQAAADEPASPADSVAVSQVAGASTSDAGGKRWRGSPYPAYDPHPPISEATRAAMADGYYAGDVAHEGSQYWVGPDGKRDTAADFDPLWPLAFVGSLISEMAEAAEQLASAVE